MISIIVVNYKSSKDIYTCLASIVKYETNYKKYEIIIVDNDSNDPDLQRLKNSFPQIKILYAPKNGGFAYGNNLGIAVATFDYIMLLNPDTYLEDNSIEKLYNRLACGSDADLIGPMLLYPDKRNQSYYLPKSYLTLWKLFCAQFNLYKLFPNSRLFNSYYRTYMDYEKEVYVEQISGAALMFKKNILGKTGLMDDNYFMYYEESDFCYQAVKNNCRLLYYPQSKIIHIGGYSNTSKWHSNVATQSLKYYFKKNFSTVSSLIALLLFNLGETIRRSVPKKKQIV